MEKIYYIKSIHRNSETIWEGTLEYLVSNVFGYSLMCGNSHDKRIRRFPKSAKTLVNALNNSASVCNRFSDYYELSSKAEFDNAENCEPMR